MQLFFRITLFLAVLVAIPVASYRIPSADWGIRRQDDGLVLVQLPSFPVDFWGTIRLSKTISPSERAFVAQTICTSLGGSTQEATVFLSDEVQHTLRVYRPVVENLSCHAAQSHISSCTFSTAMMETGDDERDDVFVQCGKERVFLRQDEMSNGGASISDDAVVSGIAVVSFSSQKETVVRCLASQLQVDASRFVLNLTAISLRQEYKYFSVVVNATTNDLGSVKTHQERARLFLEEGSTTGTDTVQPTALTTSSTTTTTAAPVTTAQPTTTTASPVTTAQPTTTTAAPVTTAQPTTTTASPITTAQPTTTTATPRTTAKPTTTTAPVTAPPPHPSARTSTRSFSTSLNTLQNNQLANSVVSQLLQLLPPETLLECGIYELRSGEGLLDAGTTQVVPRAGSFELARATLVNRSEPSAGFGKVMKKFEGILTRSTCCGLWDDDHATEVCRALAPNASTPSVIHGFAVNSIASDQGNNLPILDQYLPATRTSSESAYFDKTNACTHSDDAGVMCSFVRQMIAFGVQRVYRVVLSGNAPPATFASALSVLIPSSTGRLNLTRVVANEFVMQFLPYCGKDFSAAPEVELLDLMLEWVDATVLARLSQLSEISILGTVPSRHCDTVSASITLSLPVEQVIVYLRLSSGSNGTVESLSNNSNGNETVSLRLALFLGLSPQSVELVEVLNLPTGYVAVRLPSLAMALFLEGAVNQGLVDGFLAATLDNPSPPSSHDDSGASHGRSVIVLVVGTLCGLLGGFVAVMVAVVVWRKKSNRKELRFDDDGDMNTLFLPLDLSTLMELEDMKKGQQ